MTTGGVGAIPLNVQAKLKCDEDLILVTRTTQTEYTKALKGIWMECDWKSASNKLVRCKKISLFMQYHDSKMIYCQ
jgi:hypothetical protein